MLKKLLILPIKIYQLCISPWCSGVCRFRPTCSQYMIEAIQIKDKLEKYAKIDEVKEEAITKYTERHEGEEDLEANLKLVKKVADEIEGAEVRRLITNEHIRPDGRAMDEIRELSADVDLLPRTHGSALFTRGQTQALAITTLGAQNEEQILDGLSLEESKKFIFL